VNKSLYSSDIAAFRTIVRTEGFGGLLTGFGATFVGYSFQGACKYGFYEIFKKKYWDLLGDDVARKYARCWPLLGVAPPDPCCLGGSSALRLN
jgi:solute carrier family 25 phosphate transporter 3